MTQGEEVLRVEVREGAVFELNLEELKGYAIAAQFGNWAEIDPDVGPLIWPLREEVSEAASKATGRCLLLDVFHISSQEESEEEELILHFKDVPEATQTVVEPPRQVSEAEDSLNRIKEASKAVDAAQDGVLGAKEELKAKKSVLAAAVSHLQEVIRAETTPLPLFDHARQRQQEDDQDDEEQVQEQGNLPGIPSDQWRYVGLNTALPRLPEALLRKLHEHGLHTVGDVPDFTARSPLTDVPGIGQAKAELIEKAFDDYWAGEGLGSRAG